MFLVFGIRYPLAFHALFNRKLQIANRQSQINPCRTGPQDILQPFEGLCLGPVMLSCPEAEKIFLRKMREGHERSHHGPFGKHCGMPRCPYKIGMLLLLIRPQYVKGKSGPEKLLYKNGLVGRPGFVLIWRAFCGKGP